MMLQDPRSDDSNQLSEESMLEYFKVANLRKALGWSYRTQWLGLTMIALPLAYTILSLLLLNLVGSPRLVFGFAG